MYATKQPSLRIKQADLKCKNGCGFYGNAEWGGYCSICYRDSVQRERQKKGITRHASEHSKSPIPGFSKFEEKKRQQTDKKNKYLKNLTPVFRKGSSAKDSGRPDIYHEIRHPNPEAEKLKAEYITTYRVLGDGVEKDFFKCINSCSTKIIHELEKLTPVEDIRDIVQKYYNLFSSRMENEQIYAKVSPETREQMLDFFEKFIMICLYSVLFCPTSTTDEEKDLAIQARIRKLSWVNAYHLDCRISETSIEVRDLVYAAITELLGMDSVKAPQEKLACVVQCCRSVVSVLQHCQGGPVSADEFLPALIFVVLKANPARLKSNIHFVTRFCNDKRLMQGEGGYYFTNLCCAVSFIENLTAESLNMSEEEFNGYMSGAVTPVSAWESALVACEGMHQLREHLTLLTTLSERIDKVQSGTKELNEEIKTFQDDIKKKVAAVLARTPLEIKPRKTPIDLDRKDSIGDTLPPPLLPIVLSDSNQPSNSSGTDAETNPSSSFYSQNLQLQLLNMNNEKVEKEKISPKKLQLNITPSIETPDSAVPSEIKPSQSTEFLSPSPVFGFGSFDQQSLDGFTPDDAAQSHLLGLSNINYDIDFSDISGDNSVAEDASPEKRNKSPIQPDPFSPVGSHPSISQAPLIPAKVETKKASANDSFKLPFVDNDSMEKSILDESEKSVEENLPSPIKPLGYMGFSRQGWQIPSIPCNTGDYSLLNVTSGEENIEKDDKNTIVSSEAASGGGASAVDEETPNSKPTEKSQAKKEDTVVKVLSGVLDTFDKLF